MSAIAELLEKELHVKSDCTLFHVDSVDVLVHVIATAAALSVPQYDPVWLSSSMPAKAMSWGP